MAKDIKELNKDTFNNFIMEKGKVVVVDFFATWCGPCKMLAPILSDIAKETNDDYQFGKVDIDQCFSIAKTYTVMSVPTIIVFNDGVEVKRVVGLRSKEDLINEIM